MTDVRLDTNFIDYAILITYFVVVLGVGFAAKRYVHTCLDYFLSGRSLPAWITGLAFISANLGAIEVLGMAANGAQYGVATVNYYWIGAIPAMVFLGLVMMPFYYGSKVRSVPEYLRLRFNDSSHIFNSLTFALATILIAGVNLYALALVLKLHARLADHRRHHRRGVHRRRLHQPRRPLLGDLQRGAPVLRDRRGAAPADDRRPADVGGWNGLKEKIRQADDRRGRPARARRARSPGDVTNPIGATWIGIVFGLGFVLAFGYWTTNFAEVQRALSAKDLSAAQRTPLIGAIPKLFLPFIMILPGMIALVVIPGSAATTRTCSTTTRSRC